MAPNCDHLITDCRNSKAALRWLLSIYDAQISYSEVLKLLKQSKKSLYFSEGDVSDEWAKGIEEVLLWTTEIIVLWWRVLLHITGLSQKSSITCRHRGADRHQIWCRIVCYGRQIGAANWDPHRPFRNYGDKSTNGRWEDVVFLRSPSAWICG